VRRYHGGICDSARWEGFPLRKGDVIITSPSKCGTTWMQTLVGTLLLGDGGIDRPMGLISPWLDMLTRNRQELFDLLDAQEHRRFIKTHTPIDGLPSDDQVTYLAIVRHPLDAALSNRDHAANEADGRIAELRAAASGDVDLSDLPPRDPPHDAAEFLRWWIDCDYPSTGTGLNSLADFAHHAAGYWELRHEPNVHLFHYADLQAHLAREVGRLAEALGVELDADSHAAAVRAAGFEAMRSRASLLAPDAHAGMWRSDADFFRQGGRRDWASLLTPDEITAAEAKLVDLAGPDAARWSLHGRGGA
jgi:aryl sulfotransferase